jgi:hypothetical protein
MYLRGNQFALSTSRAEDFHLAAAVGILLAVFAGLAFGFYWLMQPTVIVNYGSAYHPPPKAVVHYANSPWVPPTPSEPPPMMAEASPAPEPITTAEPKKETKKQEVRVAPRRQRPAREQQDPFWGGFASSSRSYGWGGYASSSRSYGSRPWF